MKNHKTTNKLLVATMGLTSASLFLTSTVAAMPALSEVTAEWGPSDRPIYTMESPADHPVFNSIENAPGIGNEQDFVRIGEIHSDVTQLANEVEIVPGKQYLVSIYFHNNASATYNGVAYQHKGVALDTFMKTSFSTVLTPENRGSVLGIIESSNADPKYVWDHAYMTTKTNKVLMRYVVGSAKIYNNWKTNGMVMKSSLFSDTGTELGLNDFNGIIPGCEEYHGRVTYVLQAEELGGSIGKEVSKDGINYAESASLAPGEEVYFRLTIENTGDVALTNAIVKDSLPVGLTLVPGSVELRANNSTTPDQLTDDLTSGGYNLGRIGTGNVAYITYRAVAGSNFDCTGQELTNTATLTYDSDQKTGDSKDDSATVTVKQENCDEPEPPLDTCETNPGMDGCPKPETCETNPNLEGCPKPEKNCKTNPEMEGCQELPSTGPLEIVMAAVVLIGIGGGGYYLYRTRKTLNKVENTAKGDDAKDKTDTTPTTPPSN